MSFGYFDEKPKVQKRQAPKRKAEKVVKQESLQVIFEKFLDYKVKQNLRSASLNQHVGLFKSVTTFHATRFNRPLYLTDITTEFISDYVYYLKNEVVRFDGHKYKPKEAQTVGLKDISIVGKIKYLRVFMNWCIKEDLLKKDPFAKFEGFKKDSNSIEILTKDEINNLLKVVKSHSTSSYKNYRDYVLLHVLVDCMFRITECLTLAPSDIDHVNRTLIVRSNNAKSRRTRVVPLSNKTYRLLTQLMEENKQFDGETDDLIFLSLSGRMLDKNNCLRDFKKYAVEAGITKRFYLHLLRHSVATHYLSSSGDVESLRKIMGHADLRMILNYAHLADSTIQEKHAEHGFFSVNNSTSRKRDNKRI